MSKFSRGVCAVNCATCTLPITDMESAVNDFAPIPLTADGIPDETATPRKVYYHDGCQPISFLGALPRMGTARTPQNPGTAPASNTRAVMGQARTPETAGLKPGHVGQMGVARTPWNKSAPG